MNSQFIHHILSNDQNFLAFLRFLHFHACLKSFCCWRCHFILFWRSLMYICQFLFIENVFCIDAAHAQYVGLTSISVTVKFHPTVEFLADLLAHRHDKAHAIVIILPLICLIWLISVAFLQTQMRWIKAFECGSSRIDSELYLKQELAFCLLHICPWLDTEDSTRLWDIDGVSKHILKHLNHSICICNHFR